MAQNYLWKVEYEQEYTEYCGKHTFFKWERKSKTFANKIMALQFVNRLENNSKCRNIRFKKWFG